MGFQEIKILTGTTLSLLLSVVAVYPASAAPSGVRARSVASLEMKDASRTFALAQATDGTTNTTDTNVTSPGVLRGRIKSVVGDVVTLVLPDGTTKSVTVTKEDRTRLNLREGLEIVVKRLGNSDGADVTVELANDSSTTTTTDTTTSDTTGQQIIRGTVRNIDGNQVTVEMPDGTSQTITLTQDDMNRLNLRTGRRIVATMNNGVTIVNLANNANTDTNPTSINRRTTTLQRQTSTSTTTSPSTETDTTDTSPSVQRGTVTTPRRTNVAQRRTYPTVTTRTTRHRPVRALW